MVRAYLRFAYSEPPESRLLWDKEWRSQARAAMIQTTRYWTQKYRAARTAVSKAAVLQEYEARLQERELQV